MQHKLVTQSIPAVRSSDAVPTALAQQHHSAVVEHTRSTTFVRTFLTKAEILARVHRLKELGYVFGMPKGRPARGVRPGIPALAVSLNMTPQKASTAYHHLDEIDFAGIFVNRPFEQISKSENSQHPHSPRPPQVPTMQPVKSRLDRLR